MDPGEAVRGSALGAGCVFTSQNFPLGPAPCVGRFLLWDPRTLDSGRLPQQVLSMIFGGLLKEESGQLSSEKLFSEKLPRFQKILVIQQRRNQAWRAGARALHRGDWQMCPLPLEELTLQGPLAPQGTADKYGKVAWVKEYRAVCFQEGFWGEQTLGITTGTFLLSGSLRYLRPRDLLHA